MSKDWLKEAREKRQKRIDEVVMPLYEQIPDHVKNNVFEARHWAVDRLMRREGSGHMVYIHRAYKQDGFQCSFAKPEWAGDHCSAVYETGAKAIVMAVLEYENGF